MTFRNWLLLTTSLTPKQQGRVAVSPSEAEGRVDALISLLFYRDKADDWHSLARFGEIERTDSGKPRAVRVVPETETDRRMDGMFFHLISKEPVDEERALAKDFLDACQQSGALQSGFTEQSA